jgi:CRP/FNR family cyclic AMP-dependent transcriptional regulator
MMRQMGINLVN